jgi:hypothetical protein
MAEPSTMQGVGKKFKINLQIMSLENKWGMQAPGDSLGLLTMTLESKRKKTVLHQSL